MFDIIKCEVGNTSFVKSYFFNDVKDKIIMVEDLKTATKYKNKKTLVLLMASLFLFTLGAAPVYARGEGDSAEMLYIILDFTMARPAGLAITVFGAAFFLAALPLSAPLGDHEKVLRIFVVEPGEFTFLRPLGEF